MTVCAIDKPHGHVTAESHRLKSEFFFFSVSSLESGVQKNSYRIDTMKRKTESNGQANGQPGKKRALSSEEAATRFRDGLFDGAEQQRYTKEYAQSAPYV